MPFDHYLPATYLARSSLDTTGPRRNRRVWVVDKRSASLFRTPVASICGDADLYTVDHENPRIIDGMWSGYEGRLHDALNNLIAGTIDARTWANTLVQFVAALLVRGRDFDQRLQQRLVPGFGPAIIPLLGERPDNTNWARLMEWQRLRASVIGARWSVLQTTGHFMQITNDLGSNGHMEFATRTLGIAIPIGVQHILTVRPTTRPHVVAIAKDGVWWPRIEYHKIDDAQQQGALRAFAASAQRFIVGPDEETMRRFVVQEDVPPPVPEPVSLGFMGGKMARRYEHTWLRVLGEISKPPNSDGDVLYVDYGRNMMTSEL